MSRFGVTLIAIASLVLSLVAISAPQVAFADPPNRSKLDKKGRQVVATAAANGNSSVTLLIAAADGTTASVISALRGLGGNVRKSDSEIGYIRVDIAADKADQASKIAGVLAAEVDEIIPIDLPKPEFSSAKPNVLPPDATTPAANPYMPTQDIGAPQFVAAHPTWDGRGVTIGILDTGVDLGHPALQTTTTGARKIIEWVTYTDPLTDNDPMWIVMGTTVTVAGGTFAVGANTYTGAPNGTWKFGLFNEGDARFGGGIGSEYSIDCDPLPPDGPPPANQRVLLGGDLNRNGVCNERFAILWDGTDRVWIDSDTDKSFADEAQMQPYSVKYDVGEFGHDNTATAIRESVPFVVQVDASSNAVNIGIPSGAHATHVAGIAAGKDFFGPGTYDGAAPGAKIVSIRVCLFVSGCTAHALIEGMIFAAKVANVDTINMSIGGLPALNDGNNARAILYNSLIDKKGVQMFISAGNSGPGVNTVGDPSVATKVMSIGAYWTKESVLANYGNVVSTSEALHDFSSRGPREDGGFKPNVIAPGNAVSGIPTWQPGQCLTSPNCPPGYGMFNGTSMAAPQAAGASALLLSAAGGGRDSHSNDSRFRPAALRQAMRSSARFIPGYAAHEQGFGLINVGRAWDLLRSNVKTSELTSAVPTNTLLSGFLATPGVGTGIYDREGITPTTAKYTRTYTFSGDSGTYNLSWIGNDGTFALPVGTSSITVSKGGTTLPITVTPTTIGAHSAILVLDDPRTAGIDHATMNTLIVAQSLSAANGYTATLSGSATKFEDAPPRFFFQVPAGTTALRVTTTITNNGRMRWFRVHPFGVPIDSSATTAFFTGPGSQTRTTQVSPLPGVWEIGLAASRAAVPDASTFTVTATAYRVDFSPAAWTQDPATVGTPYSQSFTASNVYAAGTIGTVGTAFASARSVNASIAAGGAQQTYDFTVPTGTTNLTVTLGNASDPGADLDVFVFDCTAGPTSCVLKGQGVGSTANETVSIASPTPGAWKSVVDPFNVPAGTTTYTYSDSFTNPVYGSVSADTAFVTRGSGSTWPVAATATALASAGAGRQLRAAVQARLDSATGPVIGSAPVVFITP